MSGLQVCIQYITPTLRNNCMDTRLDEWNTKILHVYQTRIMVYDILWRCIYVYIKIYTIVAIMYNSV